MCGLVGVAGLLNVRDENTIRRLLMLDYFRGPDSTGMAAVRNNGDFVVAKLATAPPVLFDSHKFKVACDGPKSKVFLGHNRLSTKGATNDFNAHPFEFGDIVGAHNGTLDYASWKRLEKAIGEEFNVDSQALIAAIDRLGIKEAISLCETGDDSSTGAWSLVWYDKKDGSLNFLRNEHRPMWIAYEKDFHRLFWASQWPMIDAAVRLSEMGEYELYTEGKENYRYFQTECDQHYSFDLGVLMNTKKKPKPKVATIKGREPVKVAYSSGKKDNPFPRTNTNGCGLTPSQLVTRELQEAAKTSSTTSTTTSHGGTTRRSKPDNVLHWQGTEHFPYAGLIDKSKFERIAKDGCSWCCESLEWGDACVVYERDDVILCLQCSAISNDNDGVRIFVTPAEFERLR